MQTRHLTLACAHCGRAAAEISLLPGTAEGESQWHAQDRLERTDFMGTVIKFGAYMALLPLFEAVGRGDYAAARHSDPDFVAFICDACSQPYCAQCWDLRAPVFDEGFYDYTAGVCPQGHEQIVDD